MSVLQFPEQPNTSGAYYGTCPKCRKSDGFLNIGRDLWSHCDQHQTKWFIGKNLFSDSEQETWSDWQRNGEKLENYTEIEPYYGKEAGNV
ncbi:MAG: hypothetical protein JKY95_17925 [Planctomycetaceae bacterium]|nr:hypothetical protein [Planctomycetaceae bacterium]